MSAPYTPSSYPYWPNSYNSSANGTLVPVGTIIQYPLSTPPSGYLNCDGSALNRLTYNNLFSVLGTAYGAGDGTSQNVSSWIASGTTLTLNFTSPLSNLYLNPNDTFSFGNGVVFYNNVSVTSSSSSQVVGTLQGSSSSNGTFGTAIKLNASTFNLPNAKARTIRGYDGSTYNIAGTGGADSYALTASNIASHAHGTFQPGGSALAGSGNRAGEFNVGGPNTTAVIYDASSNTVTNSGSNGAAFSLVNSYLVLNYCIKY
jgi:microcystin-dependent protein